MISAWQFEELERHVNRLRFALDADDSAKAQVYASLAATSAESLARDLRGPALDQLEAE